MAFGGSGGKGRPRSDINITPLVDVVLVLLIIFMVLTPILLKQIALQVPEKADTSLATPPTTSQVVLRINADGTLALNQEPIARETLSDKLHALFAPRREKLMFFDVDDQANYGIVVETMDVCRGAGAKVLGIMTK